MSTIGMNNGNDKTVVIELFVMVIIAIILIYFR